VKVVSPTTKGIAQAADAICAGQVVAYPTETVYGLAVNPFSEQAVQRLFATKTRDGGNPVLVIVSGPEQLDKLVATVSDIARAYMERFWPGPLSLLFPKAVGVPESLTAGHSTLCIRCPACDIARALCQAAGPVTSSSANVSGGEPARCVDEIVLPGVALAIDGGPLKASLPSTILDPETGKILRPGVITAAELAAAEIGKRKERL